MKPNQSPASSGSFRMQSTFNNSNTSYFLSLSHVPDSVYPVRRVVSLVFHKSLRGGNRNIFPVLQIKKTGIEELWQSLTVLQLVSRRRGVSILAIFKSQCPQPFCDRIMEPLA